MSADPSTPDERQLRSGGIAKPERRASRSDDQ